MARKPRQVYAHVHIAPCTAALHNGWSSQQAFNRMQRQLQSVKRRSVATGGAAALALHGEHAKVKSVPPTTEVTKRGMRQETVVDVLNGSGECVHAPMGVGVCGAGMCACQGQPRQQKAQRAPTQTRAGCGKRDEYYRGQEARTVMVMKPAPSRRSKPAARRLWKTTTAEVNVGH